MGHEAGTWQLDTDPSVKLVTRENCVATRSSGKVISVFHFLRVKMRSREGGRQRNQGTFLGSPRASEYLDPVLLIVFTIFHPGRSV